MVYTLDGKIDPGKAVRTIIYTEDSDLSSSTITDANGTVLECAVGSVAFKPGFADMKNLGPDGWVSC